MTEEGALQRKIMLAVSAAGARVFRNNNAMGWVSSRVHIARAPERLALAPGDAVLRQARPLHAGLMKGSGDLIGWEPVLITEAHVGMTIAVFLSLEVKTAAGVIEKDQENFDIAVRNAGGISGFVRSVADALALISTLAR